MVDRDEYFRKLEEEITNSDTYFETEEDVTDEIKKKIKTVKDGEGKKRRHRGRHHAKKSEKKTTTKVERPKRNKNIGSLRQLSKYKDLISLLADGDMKDNTKFTIMNSLHDREFNSICKCVHDILYDKGPMKGKIHDSQFSHLADTLTPYKKDLRKFASKNVPIKACNSKCCTGIYEG